jgi:hypothetical protein
VGKKVAELVPERRSRVLAHGSEHRVRVRLRPPAGGPANERPEVIRPTHKEYVRPRMHARPVLADSAQDEVPCMLCELRKRRQVIARVRTHDTVYKEMLGSHGAPLEVGMAQKMFDERVIGTRAR